MCLPEARLCHKSPRKHGRRQCPRILSRASRRPDDCRFQIPCLLLATRLTFCPSLSICPSWRRFRFCAEALSTPAGLRPERLPRPTAANGADACPPSRARSLLQLGPSFRSPLVPCCYHLLASNPAGQDEEKRQHTSRTHRASPPWLSMGTRHCVRRGRHDWDTHAGGAERLEATIASAVYTPAGGCGDRDVRATNGGSALAPPSFQTSLLAARVCVQYATRMRAARI